MESPEEKKPYKTDEAEEREGDVVIVDMDKGNATMAKGRAPKSHVIGSRAVGSPNVS